MKGNLVRLQHLFWFLFLIDLPLTTNNSLSPVILSEPLKINKPKGETVKFHCKVKHQGNKPVVWRRGFDVLATGAVVVSADPRVSVQAGRDQTTLVINRITEQDAGEYVCQISVLNDILSVQHSLNVLVSPTVISVPPSGAVSVKEGEETVLQCEVTGNPRPAVTWTRTGDGAVLPSSARESCPDQSCLSLANVGQGDGGLYQCRADNGVGEPDQATIALTVLYPPLIKVTEEKIHSGPGSNVVISCEVLGEPKPSVQWYHGSSLVGVGRGSRVRQTGDTHSLVLDTITVRSFGNYSCVARNSLGTYKKYIELHGRPTSAVFSSEAAVSGRNFYELSWQVDSFVPLLEYRLLYRRIGGESGAGVRVAGSDWTNVIIPGADRSYREKQVMHWRLDNLLPETTYECLVQARNEYGWSLPSKMFRFTTTIHSVKSAATQGLNWNSSSGQSSLDRGIVLHITRALPAFLLALPSLPALPALPAYLLASGARHHRSL